MRKPFIALVLALLALASLASPARADDTTITIKPPKVPMGNPSITPTELDINEGDTVTFVNEDTTPHDVTFRTGGMRFSVPAKTGATNGSYTLPPVGGSFDFYLDDNPDPDGVGGSVKATAAPATTTTAPATTTTAKPTTTTAQPTTTSPTSSTTSSTSSTTSTTSTSTTTSTTVPTTVTASSSGGSGSSSALVLGVAALIVAALAGLAFAAYRRSQDQPYDDPDGWESPDDWADGEPPPTTMGPIT